MRYKMIALDLDGTLNNDQKTITQKTKAALIAVQKQGVIVVLASGRPSSGLKRESNTLDLHKYHGLLLSYNGGKIIDATTEAVIFEKSMPTELAVRFLKYLEAFPVNPIVEDGRYIYTTDKNGFKLDYETEVNNLKIKLVNNIADAVDFSPIKVLIAAPNEILIAASRDIIASFGDELSFIQSAPFYLEATMKGITKAASLQTICDILQIRPEEVMAFGDAQNDLSMIKFAGLGVAMGNACQELKAAADEITRSNNEDGIAYTLQKYYEIADKREVVA